MNEFFAKNNLIQSYQKVVDNFHHFNSEETSEYHNYVLVESNPFSEEYFLSIIACFELDKTAVLMNRAWGEAEKNKINNIIKDNDLTGIDLVLFSSGSSGTPKAVMHTKETLLQSIESSIEYFNMRESDHSIVSLPMHHIGGLMIALRAFYSNGYCSFPESPEYLDELIKKNNYQYLSLVPSQLYKMLKERELVEKLRNFKAIILGGAKTEEVIWNKATDLGLPLFQTFGMSETAAMVMAHDSTVYNLFTPLPGRIIELNPEGYLKVGIYGLMKGYLGVDHLDVFESNGSFLTNDLFEELNGKFLFVKRGDLMINRGGENIDPLEIESIAYGVPGLESVHIVPCAHNKWGEVPIAYLEPFSLMNEVKEKIESSLMKYKWPFEYYSYPEEIITKIKNSFKISRNDLRK